MTRNHTLCWTFLDQFSFCIICVLFELGPYTSINNPQPRPTIAKVWHTCIASKLLLHDTTLVQIVQTSNWAWIRIWAWIRSSQSTTRWVTTFIVKCLNYCKFFIFYWAMTVLVRFIIEVSVVIHRFWWYPALFLTVIKNRRFTTPVTVICLHEIFQRTMSHTFRHAFATFCVFVAGQQVDVNCLIYLATPAVWINILYLAKSVLWVISECHTLRFRILCKHFNIFASK